MLILTAACKRVLKTISVPHHGRLLITPQLRYTFDTMPVKKVCRIHANLYAQFKISSILLKIKITCRKHSSQLTRQRIKTNFSVDGKKQVGLFSMFIRQISSLAQRFSSENVSSHFHELHFSIHWTPNIFTEYVNFIKDCRGRFLKVFVHFCLD